MELMKSKVDKFKLDHGKEIVLKKHFICHFNLYQAPHNAFNSPKDFGRFSTNSNNQQQL